MGSRERERNLRHEIGKSAAAAVGQSRQAVEGVALQHRVLAAQMVELERQLAVVKESRRVDRALIDELKATRYDCVAVGKISDVVPLPEALRLIQDAIVRVNKRRVELDDRVYALEQRTIWQRLRAAFTRLSVDRGARGLSPRAYPGEGGRE